MRAAGHKHTKGNVGYFFLFFFFLLLACGATNQLKREVRDFGEKYTVKVIILLL